MIRLRHRWLVCAAADAALCLLVAAVLSAPLFYLLALLTFPAWAWLDGRAEVRHVLDRLFRG